VITPLGFAGCFSSSIYSVGTFFFSVTVFHSSSTGVFGLMGCMGFSEYSSTFFTRLLVNPFFCEFSWSETELLPDR
jgi:hypothetical protein